MGKINFLLRTSFLVALGIVCCFVFTIKDACATWNEIAQLNAGRGANAGVIYFIDAKTGFIGFSNKANPIWMSTDSGATWTAATTPLPVSGGWVSDIWFSAPNDGWATIGGGGNSPGQLWHSTDTGNTWVNCNSFTFTDPSSVRRTSRGLCVAGDQFGVAFSSDTSATFTETFNQSMRGLDFVDDSDFVCTPYSSPNYYYSSDGGRSWHPTASVGGDSWGILGIKGSPTFFVAPENSFSRGGPSNVYRSDNYGATWKFVSSLQFKTTGDINGTSCAMFIQNSDDTGIYRSIDQGVTWTNIGGPVNYLDTRFTVIDGGQIIYALDDNNGVWKTTDGGDGFTGGSSATLGINTNPIDFGAGTACQMHDTVISYTNDGCLPLTVNSWSMSQGSSSFNVYDTGQSFPITLTPGQTDSLHISYVSGTGQIYDTVLVSSNADTGEIRRIPVEINITGNNSRTLAIDTAAINFGTDNLCATRDTIISFADTGCHPLTVTGWSMSQSGTGFNVSGLRQPDSLAPGQTDSLHLTYSSGSGHIYDTVIVTGDAANGPAWRIPVEINIKPIDSVNFVVALSNDPVKPNDALTVTISPDRTVQGFGLNSISGVVEYHSDSYDFISASGGAAGAAFNYTRPYAIGKTAHLPFTISSATDISLDPSSPILKILLQARLSDTAMTNFVLDSLLLNGSDPNYGNCVLAYSSDTAISHTELACGDTLLLLAMRNQLAFDVENPQPNPITSEDGYQSTLTLHSATDGIAEVRVTDMLGRMVASNTIALSAGETSNYSLDLSHEPSGSYFYAVQFSSQYGVATRSGTVMVLR